MNEQKRIQITLGTHSIKNLMVFTGRPYNPAVQHLQWHIEFYSSMTSLLT